MQWVMKRRGYIVGLLMAVMIISALDKMIFAFAGANIIHELSLTPEAFGLVGSAFFFLYSVSGVIVGFLANRFASTRILLGMAAVWMVAQLMAVFSTGFTGLLISRLMLGAGTGPATAITQHACFKWYAPTERVLPASLISSSIMAGALLGALSLPWAVDALGWRMAYLMLAGLGLVWMSAWLLLGREGTYRESTPAAAGEFTAPLAYRRLLLNRTFVCITLLAFVCYVPSALGVSWSIVYLTKALGLTTMQAGYFNLGTAACAIMASLTVSSLSHAALKRGAGVFRAMVLPPLACSGFGGLLFAFTLSANQQVPVVLALMGAGSVLVNVVPAFSMSIISYFCPARQRGSVLAIHSALLTSAGILVPYLTGRLIAAHGNDVGAGFQLMLTATGVAILVCATVGATVISPARTKARLQPAPQPA